MSNSQQQFDVYELLLKNIDIVIDYIKRMCNHYSNDNILKYLRRFVADETSLALDEICVIINEDIPHNHKDPLRLFFNEELYLDESQERYH